MTVRAARLEPDSTGSQAARLALNSLERVTVIDDEVVTGVLAKRNQDFVAGGAQREHDSQRGSIANLFRVAHVDNLGNRSDRLTHHLASLL